MFQLKPITKNSIPQALEKAERYRFLNEPGEAESICLDILEIDPQNEKAIITLLLAITDQFGTSSMGHEKQVKQLLPRLSNEYERHYYAGIISERMGKATLAKRIPDGHYIAHEWLTDAMNHYSKAESIRPEGNDDAILRWNTCLRVINSHHLEPRNEKYIEQQLE